jgi:hypothetical protein
MTALTALFRGNSVKPAWEFQSAGIIWRILFSPHNLFVGETRNQETKSTSFFCIDAFTGKPLWEGIKFDEPWWIGIETVYDKWIILHKFARPDMPRHRGILVVELVSGKLVWKNDELTYWFAEDQKLYAYKYIFEKRLGFEVDIVTGTVLKEYTESLDELHELRKNILQKESESLQDMIFPKSYNREFINSEVTSIIQEITREHVIEGWIEYLHRNSILIMSYYRKIDSSSKNTLENVLVIYNTERKEIKFNEIIAKGMQVPSPDTFFIRDEYLYFFKDKNKFTALKPWKS